MATKQKAPSKKQAPSFLSLYNKTFGFSLGTARRFKWMPKLPVLFFLRAVSPTTAKQSLYLFDARTSKERLVLDVKQLLGKRATAKLTAAEKRFESVCGCGCVGSRFIVWLRRVLLCSWDSVVTGIGATLFLQGMPPHGSAFLR
jgi:hypothetical protein